MSNNRNNGSPPESADGVTERNPTIPASEEGTGVIPGKDRDNGGEGDTGGGGTHLPASEADTGQIEDEGAPAVSWPGRGGPGTIPPPG